MQRSGFGEGVAVVVTMALTASLAIAAAPPDTAAAKTAKDSVEAMNRKLNDFISGKASKQTTCGDFYAADVVFLQDKHPIMYGNKVMLEGCPTPDPSIKEDFFGSTRKLAAASGDLVIDSGWVKFPRGPLKGQTHTFMAVWQKQADGSWKLIRDMTIPPRQPAPDEKEAVEGR